MSYSLRRVTMKSRTGLMMTAAICVLAAAAGGADLYERAPDVQPGTLPEMRNPSYWIERMDKPDEVVLPLDEILRRNRAYQAWASSPNPFEGVPEDRIPIPYFYPGVVLNPPDMHALELSAVADTVRKRIRDQVEYLRGTEWGNPFAVKYAVWEIEVIVDEMALEAVSDDIHIRDAITVHTSRIRNVPALYPQFVGTGDSGSHRWDRWSIGLIKIGRPVTVLHASASGEFLFVLCEYAYGWVRSENVAFGGREEIASFADSPAFVMCTGDRVQLYTDKNCRYSTGWFMMSDRLPMASRLNTRLVQIPVRKTSGDFAIDVAWLAPDADVHVDYLPYTRRNIVLQAFKLLDGLYDFTGALLGRQHETVYRDVFACFGFELPRTDPLYTFYGDDETVLHPEAGKEEQYRLILDHEPFVTLQSCGRHGQLFLGEYEGEPIVFDQHGYGYEDENGIRLEVMRVNIGTLLLPEYFLQRNITFLELK